MSKMDVSFIETTATDGAAIRHVFVKQTENPLGLLVILPGRGYTLENPLLWYLRTMAAEIGYDILGITYSFQMTLYNRTADIDYDALTTEIHQALDLVTAQIDYKRVVIAGKSLGTPLAVRLTSRFENLDLRFLLLTPIMHSTDYVGNHPTLAIIGTADSAYDAGKIEHDKHKSWLQWHVYDGLNHSLEFERGWDASIAVLGNVIAVCEAFLKREK